MLVLAVIVHMLKYAQMGSEKGCRSCKKLALRDNEQINKELPAIESSLYSLSPPGGKGVAGEHKEGAEEAAGWRKNIHWLVTHIFATLLL